MGPVGGWEDCNLLTATAEDGLDGTPPLKDIQGQGKQFDGKAMEERDVQSYEVPIKGEVLVGAEGAYNLSPEVADGTGGHLCVHTP